MWAGAKDRKNKKKVKCDGPTDQWMDRPMDGPTDGLTKQVVESRSTQLKIGKFQDQPILNISIQIIPHKS